MTSKKIVTITGPSGSGKTTLLNHLVSNHGFRNVISHTTRFRREGEVEGQDYFFVSPEFFDSMEKAGAFAESIKFKGNYYGVSKASLFSDQPGIPVVIVEPNGLEQIVDTLGRDTIEAVYLFAANTTLIDRYLSRMTIGDLSDSTKRKFHAERLASIANELSNWSNSTVVSYDISKSFENTDDINKVTRAILTNLGMEHGKS